MNATRSDKTRSTTLWSRAKKSAVMAMSAGTMFASSCSSDTVRAVIAGIDAAAGALDSSISEQDQTFGEWLLGELDD